MISSKRPALTVYLDDPTPVIQFRVSDSHSPNGLAASCFLNGQSFACASLTDLQIPATQAQNFTFEIIAQDILGNQSSASLSWQTLNRAINKQTLLSVDSVRPVDILFVIDNSGSMSNERENLAQRIDGMINVIDGLDWQIAVTSTDSRSNDAKSDGRLIEMIGMPGTHVLDSSMNVNLAQSVFGNTVQNFGNGSNTEEGIYSSKRVIQRYLNGESSHTQFIRPDADLSIVVLSDEDEHSTGTGRRISPQEFVSFVSNSLGAQKKYGLA